MLLAETTLPDWVVGVLASLIAAGIVGTIASYAVVLSRLTRIETKLESGERRFEGLDGKVSKHSSRIRDLERVEDKRQGREERPESEGELRPRRA